jgi:hypothetical protein
VVSEPTVFDQALASPIAVVSEPVVTDVPPISTVIGEPLADLPGAGTVTVVSAPNASALTEPLAIVGSPAVAPPVSEAPPSPPADELPIPDLVPSSPAPPHSEDVPPLGTPIEGLAPSLPIAPPVEARSAPSPIVPADSIPSSPPFPPEAAPIDSFFADAPTEMETAAPFGAPRVPARKAPKPFIAWKKLGKKDILLLALGAVFWVITFYLLYLLWQQMMSEPPKPTRPGPPARKLPASKLS